MTDRKTSEEREREFDSHIRVFIDKTRGIVDLVVDDDVEVSFGRVLRNLGVGDLVWAGHFWIFNFESRVRRLRSDRRG